MQRRGSVNINDLINKFEVPENDYEKTGNIKFISKNNSSKPEHRRIFSNYSDDELYDHDENRIIRTTYKRTNVAMNMNNAKQVTKHTIASILQRISSFLEMASNFPFPRMSVMSFGLTSLLTVFMCPRGFTERALYPGFRIIFSIIYPAYGSFKAIRNKDIREYLKWIVYWIVFAFFTCVEILTDAILNWFPFYYEIKVIFLIWLLGPSSRGAMKFYKTIIHPTLISKEQEIDDIIQVAQDRGYMHVFRLGSKSVNYANRIIMQSESHENYPPLSYQLMRNMSLSSISDVDTISSSSDRKFSISSFPEQLNYRQVYSRPTGEYEFNRLDDVSSGYSSPSSPTYMRKSIKNSGVKIEEQQHYKDVERLNNLSQENSMQQRDEENFSSFSTSTTTHVDAYNQVEMKKNEKSDLKAEFFEWLKEKQRTNEKFTQPTSTLSMNLKQEDTLSSKDTTEEEKEDVKDAIEEAEKDNGSQTSDFDEFKDVVEDNNEDDDDNIVKIMETKQDDLMNVLSKLVIIEEQDNASKVTVETKEDEANDVENKTSSSSTSTCLPLTICENIENKSENESNNNIIEAKFTLTSSSPLKIVTKSLSSSNSSLSSSKVKHNKGRAPPPPGQFYDTETKKFYRETEL